MNFIVNFNKILIYNRSPHERSKKMNVPKLLQMCAFRQDPHLALKIMKRYHLSFEVANKHFVSGYKDAIQQEEEKWDAICDSLLGNPKHP